MQPRLIALRGLLIFAAANCTNAQAIDLSDAWELAFRHDPELEAARANLQAVEERPVQSRASLLPEALLTASTSYNDRSIQGSASESFNNHDWNASLTQPVFNAADWYQLKSARADTDRARAEFSALIQARMVAVASAYFDVLRAADNRDAASTARSTAATRLQQARLQFRVGLAPITAVHDAEADFNATASEHTILQGVAVTTRELLKSRIGATFDQVAGLSPEMPIVTGEQEDPEAWIAVAMQQNHALRAAHESIRSADQTVKSRQSEHLPTVDFFANRGRTVQGGQNFLGSKIDTNVVGLRLNMPLFSGGLTSSRAREATYLQSAAEHTARSIAQNLRDNVRTLHQQVFADLQRIQAQTQAIIAAQSTLEAMQIGFNVGTRDAVDLLAGKQALREAENDLANARYNYVINQLRLKEAAGSLNPGDLLALNRWMR